MSWVVGSVGDFLKRNRNKFIWLGGTVGGGYGLFKYAQWKWGEFRARTELEQSAKANVKRRFEQNQQDCTFAVASLLPTLGEELFAALNVELITAQLQQTKQSKTAEAAGEEGAPTEEQKRQEAAQQMQRKLSMWEELKILGFTRTISAVYLVTLLIVFTHLQLNLLGRFFYLDSVVNQQRENGSDELVDGTEGGRKGVSDEAERKYLTFSWFILNVGWKRCVERVRKATEEVIGSVTLRQSVTFASLSDTIKEIRAKVETDDRDGRKAFRFDDYLLPEEGHEADVLREGGAAPVDGEVDARFVVDPELAMLLDETRDFLDSPDFHKVLSACFDEAFDILSRQIKPTFYPENWKRKGPDSNGNTDSGEDASIVTPGAQAAIDEAGKSQPMAGVIPPFSRLVHQVVNGVPNSYLEILPTQPKLKAFAVVMYTGWEDASL
ncbi:peroxin [Borealophlyctis nickersoniae]|nr:peroxin [Borealophlyctis nickersoniae]